eukprot:scaffold8.g1422.t1
MVHTAEQPLARLGFVPAAAERGQELAQSAYTKAKSLAPRPVAEQLERAEAVAAPYLTAAQDAGSGLLKTADAKVDAALAQAQRVYQDNTGYLADQVAKQKQAHAANLEAYHQAKEEYLRRVEEAVEFLKQNGLTGTARRAADEVAARITHARQQATEIPAHLLHGVEAAWQRLLALPPVRAAAGASLATYVALHDTLVHTSLYRGVYGLAAAVLERGESTRVWGAAEPLLRPALAKVSDSKYFQLALRELQPAAPSAAASQGQAPAAQRAPAAAAAPPRPVAVAAH